MITGNLVRLRPYELSDLDRVCAWVNDPEVTRYLAGALRYGATREAEEEWLRGAISHTRPPQITLAIETLDEARHIGSIGLEGISAESRKAVLGIMIGDKTCWNRGFGTDAILALLRFAFDEINLHRVWLEVHADNARAQACYRKCGFVEEGRKRHDRYRGGVYVDTIVMGVLEDEYRALQQKAAQS
jgi:RimJ/RimL family protein N-acetyltransferase